VQDFPPLVNVGVTVIVEIKGIVPVLTVVNTGTLPVPLAPKPILVAELTQL